MKFKRSHFFLFRKPMIGTIWEGRQVLYRWISIFCCFELCSRCLLAECICVCAQNSILCWWFYLPYVSCTDLGCFSPLWFMCTAFLFDITVVMIMHHKFATICKEKRWTAACFLGFLSYEIKTNQIFVKEFSHTVKGAIFQQD